MPKAKTFVVELELSAEQVKAINETIPGDIAPAHKIAGAAASLLSDLADGGFMVPPDVAKRILHACPIEDPSELIAVAEKAAGMKDGSVVGYWRPDPTYLPVLEQIAQSNGRTVQECIQNLMDYSVAQGWAYAISPDTEVVFINRKQYLELKERVPGKVDALSGEDLYHLVKGATETRETAKK